YIEEKKQREATNDPADAFNGGLGDLVGNYRQWVVVVEHFVLVFALALDYYLVVKGAERARLQEGGIANSAIDRVEHLLLAMDDHAAADAGPEVRWALCRLLQRAEEATNSIDCLMEILLRRLRPRGVWPIIRVPRTELEQWRRFNWIRQYTTVFTSTLERHLSTPLQPQERLESPPRPAPPITASELPTPPSSSSGPAPRSDADTGVMAVPDTGDDEGVKDATCEPQLFRYHRQLSSLPPTAGTSDNSCSCGGTFGNLDRAFFHLLYDLGPLHFNDVCGMLGYLDSRFGAQLVVLAYCTNLEYIAVWYYLAVLDYFAVLDYPTVREYLVELDAHAILASFSVLDHPEQWNNPVCGVLAWLPWIKDIDYHLLRGGYNTCFGYWEWRSRPRSGNALPGKRALAVGSRLREPHRKSVDFVLFFVLAFRQHWGTCGMSCQVKNDTRSWGSDVVLGNTRCGASMKLMGKWFQQGDGRRKMTGN
ncbi:unnamed protein product, partial [Symbiodinium sp. CCMP2456]